MRRMCQHGKSLRIALGVSALAGLGLALIPLEAHAQLQQQQNQQLVIRFVRDPDPAPDLKTKDLNGKELSLETYKGKVVLLNFWATWCGPCRAEIPSLIQIQEAYKDRLQIIGMDVDDDDEEKLRVFVKNEGINYPVAKTSVAVRVAYGGIAALPTLFVINQDSKVVQKHVGLFNPSLYEIEARALLDMPVPARVETFQDTGEVFLKHADRATMLPGVDTSKLTPEQRMAALHKLNAETCDCGCKYTLAQCRIYDPPCNISKERAAAIVKEAATLPAKGAAENSGAPGSSAPSGPADPTKPRTENRN
ncbi:MAG TPA: TlpA disulfide reductase family protein [Candidatus Sulfotelmatobacter sp.]|nr:TlpA disulfide reductase family protein [Candidatus Sulfotelmatobacter sp.]